MKLLFSHSRYSLYFCLKLISLKKNDKILIPDYNCDSFMTPIKELSINYQTYSIDSNLRFNLNRLKNSINKNIKVIVIVNYFGIPSQIEQISNFCKRKKILLINDNAHGASGIFNKKKIIKYGDLGFESYHKIFKRIEHLSVLSINNKELQEKFKTLKFNQKIESNYFRRFLFLVKNSIKCILFQKLKIKKIKNKNYDDNLFFDKPLSKFDINFYNNINIKKEKKQRNKNINLIMKLIKNFKVDPLHKKINKTLMIWYFPIKNYNLEFLRYLNEKKIPYLNWPSFPKELRSKKNNRIKKNIICLPLDYNYYESK